MNKRAIAPLSERGVIEVKGPDAATFLQGLITNDISRAAGGAALFAGLLSPQGKILFEFFAAPMTGEEGFVIDCLLTQAPDLVKRFGLYKLRAKIEISDRTGALAVAAVWDGPEAPPVGAVDGGIVFADPRLPGLGWRLIAPPAMIAQWTGRDGAREATAADYDAHRLALQIPEGGKDYAFADAYPHEACFDQLNGVDFKKGCYVGQEIVARMEFRKTARTRIVAIESVSGEALPARGAGLHAGEASIGKLGSVDGARGLALVRIDRAEEAATKGEPITADGAAVILRRPSWARFSFGAAGA
jgi:tRNA-modifying protein YgfZ